MTWVAEEDFESYSDEEVIDGSGNGGSGWSSAWSAGNPVYADDANVAYGSMACRAVSTTGGNTFSTRTLTSSISDSSIVFFSLAKSSTTAGTNTFTLRNAGGGRTNVRLSVEGHLRYYEGAWKNVTTFTANTYVDVKMTFDATAGTYSYQYWNGSAWSTKTTDAVMGGSGAIDRVGIGGDQGANSWIDNITATDPHASSTTNIKSRNGIAHANIKSVNGKAIANIKSLNNISNT